MTKTELRKQILKLRDAQDPVRKSRADGAICKRVLDYLIDNHISTVMSYVSFRSEVDTCGIIEGCLGLGIRVAVPRVEDTYMHFYYICSTDSLIKGYMGIYEPVGDLVRWHGSEHTLMLVPGSVFDRMGNRIGFGRGYYDRFLADHTDITTAGLCYGFQIADEIQPEEWDVPMNLVITEESIYGGLR